MTTPNAQTESNPVPTAREVFAFRVAIWAYAIVFLLVVLSGFANYFLIVFKRVKG